MAKSTTPRSSAPRKPRTTTKAAAPRLVPRQAPVLEPSAIAVRAYELFLANGGAHGYDVEHWLQAERELREGLLTSAA